MIVQADDVLCRLVQRVDPRNYRPRGPALLPSTAWSHGALLALQPQPQHDGADAQPVHAPQHDADADDFSDLLGGGDPHPDPDHGLDLE